MSVSKIYFFDNIFLLPLPYPPLPPGLMDNRGLGPPPPPRFPPLRPPVFGRLRFCCAGLWDCAWLFFSSEKIKLIIMLK